MIHFKISPRNSTSVSLALLGVLLVTQICLGQTRESLEVDDTSRAKSNGLLVAGKNFSRDQLVAWCIVPFDAKQRGPVERASMVKTLGMKRVAYDWRKRHVAEFEQEIIEYEKNGLEYFAFWNWHPSMKQLIRKHKIKPQIWLNYNGPELTGTRQEKIDAVVSQFEPVARTAKNLGLKFGIYNHGGWSGEPENLVAVCKQMREQLELDNVGIVYNFHHAHTHLEDFESKFKQLQPFLFCVNLNGMADPATVDEKTQANKILPIGKGVHERSMIQVMIRANYKGPIGVIGHRHEMDAKIAVELNLDGLETIVTTKSD